MRARPIVLALLLGCVAAPAMAQTPTPASPLTYSQPVSADAIRRIQQKLKSAGAFDGAADGNWGPESQEALQRFQQSNNLQTTGQLNPATVTMLGLAPGDLTATAAPNTPSPDAAPPPAAPPPPPPAQAETPPPPPASPSATASAPPETAAPAPARVPFQLSEDSVRIVQSRLRQLGFYYGGVDGVWGGGTQQGMQSFERARSLPVTDGLNSQTVTAMGIDPNTMQPK